MKRFYWCRRCTWHWALSSHLQSIAVNQTCTAKTKGKLASKTMDFRFPLLSCISVRRLVFALCASTLSRAIHHAFKRCSTETELPCQPCPYVLQTCLAHRHIIFIRVWVSWMLAARLRFKKQFAPLDMDLSQARLKMRFFKMLSPWAQLQWGICSSCWFSLCSCGELEWRS